MFRFEPANNAQTQAPRADICGWGHRARVCLNLAWKLVITALVLWLIAAVVELHHERPQRGPTGATGMTGDGGTPGSTGAISVAEALLTIDSASPYTVPAGVTYLVVRCIGGGAGGGSARNQSAAGGGGSGGYGEVVVHTAPGAQFTFTIGEGGDSDDGGGTTVFQTVPPLLVFGGLPGEMARPFPPLSPTGNPTFSGGAGAPVGTGGSVNAGGAPGGRGISIGEFYGHMNVASGEGGSSAAGGGAPGVTNADGEQFYSEPQSGVDAVNYGSGGSGAVIPNPGYGSFMAGGAGSAGVCFVTELA